MSILLLADSRALPTTCDLGIRCPAKRRLVGRVSFKLELTTPACPIKDEFERKARDYVSALPWVSQVRGRLCSHHLPCLPCMRCCVHLTRGSLCLCWRFSDGSTGEGPQRHSEKEVR